jgi:hypothetical protein
VTGSCADGAGVELDPVPASVPVLGAVLGSAVCEVGVCDVPVGAGASDGAEDGVAVSSVAGLVCCPVGELVGVELEGAVVSALDGSELGVVGVPVGSPVLPGSVVGAGSAVGDALGELASIEASACLSAPMSTASDCGITMVAAVTATAPSAATAARSAAARRWELIVSPATA